MRILKKIFLFIFVVAVSFISTVLVMASIHQVTFAEEIKSWVKDEYRQDKPEDPNVPIKPIDPNDELKLEDFEILPYRFYGNSLQSYTGFDVNIIVPSEYSIFKNNQSLVFNNLDETTNYFENCEIDYEEFIFTNVTGEKVTIVDESDLSRLVFPITFEGYDPIYVKADDRLEKYQVQYIDGHAFKSLQSSLESIIIPEGIVSIGDTIFEYCRNLIKVSLPNSLRSIGFASFQGCTSLSEVDLPEGIESLPEYLFSQCKNLVKVKLPTNLVEFPNSLFYGCENLENIEIPENLIRIGDMAFCECKKLNQIIIPDTVVEIGPMAFYHCESLINLEVPNVGYIREKTFEGCTNLLSITLMEGITGCGYSAFKDCVSLEEIVFPTSFHQFDISSLEGCDKLQRVLILRTDVIWLTNEDIPSYISTSLNFYVPDEIFDEYLTRENTSWLLITSQIKKISELN